MSMIGEVLVMNSLCSDSRMRREGLIRHLGLGVVDADQVAETRGIAPDVAASPSGYGANASRRTSFVT